MMIRRETARRMAGWMGGLCLLGAAARAVPAQAAVDVNQAWAAQWNQNKQHDGSWAINGHTLGLFADVYDANGQLMPGVRVQSASGINFQNLNSTLATVPQLSSLALVGLAGLALVARRRRT